MFMIIRRDGEELRGQVGNYSELSLQSILKDLSTTVALQHEPFNILGHNCIPIF